MAAVQNIETYEIFSNSIEGKNYFGIKEEISNKTIIDCQYQDINIIYNYKSLTLKDYSIIYILENDDDKTCKFCIITQGVPKISQHTYNKLKLKYFYKDKTICTINEMEYIIDINEKIIKGPQPDIWFIQDELENDEFYDLIRCNDIVLSTSGENYGYIQESIDKVFPNKTYYTPSTAFFPTTAENQLGLDGEIMSSFSSLTYDWISEFNYITGLCLASNNGRFTFLNRYFYQVGDWFDDYFDELELLKLGFISKDPTFRTIFIGNQNKIHKIRFKGNFIEDIYLRPYLYFEFNYVMEKIIGNINEDLDINEYWKLDREILNFVIDQEKIKNPSFEVTEKFILDTIRSEYFLTLVKNHFPFNIKDLHNKNQIAEKINLHNQTFGIMYSNYEIIETYD